jgi:hypothetical protein
MIAARPAAAPCAAGYAWGEDGSNRCPASYFAIDTAAACETAATAAGKAYIGSETDPSYPSGCYVYQGDNAGFYFNADAVGAGYPGRQLLCSGAALLARPAKAPCGVEDSSALGCSRATMGYSRATIGHTWGTIGVLTGYHGVHTGYSGARKYPASGRKEALDAAHGWLDAHSLSAWARELLRRRRRRILGTPPTAGVLIGY